MTRKKACNSSFESAVMKNVAYLYAKTYIVIIQRIFFLINVVREELRLSRHMIHDCTYILFRFD